MADKLLRSIKFPTLPDRYVIGDSTLTEEGAAAEAKAVGEALATKADTKGRYEDLIVGGAEQLMADGYETDKEPYLFRTTGGSADVGNLEYLDKIVGGTVGWNQKALHGDFDSTTNWYKGAGVDSWSASSNVLTTTINGGSTLDPYKYGIYQNINGGLDTTHKYLSVYGIKPSVATTFRLELGGGVKKATETLSANVWSEVSFINTPSTYNSQIYFYPYSALFNVSAPEMTIQYRNAQLFDLTQMFGSAIADYIYSLEQSQAGAGVAWFRNYFPKDYYPYDPGTLRSVEGVSAHETVGFNAWDEVAESGLIGISNGQNANGSGIRSKNYCKCVPSTSYYCLYENASSTSPLYIFWYDADKNYISYDYKTSSGTTTSPQNAQYFRIRVDNISTYNNDICINLSDPTRNGEYEPYQKHTYPLDSSLTLRGVPKLVDGKLAFDGDVYPPSGEVQRRYGVVDLGTLDYTITPSGLFSSTVNGAKGACSNAIAKIISIYTPITSYEITGPNGSNPSPDMTMAMNENATIYLNNLSYTDAASFKTAMSGVYLVYELATPTTETTEGYEQYQRCDPSGTEEFVTTGIVPVGHETRYPHDLKKKIETAPDSPSADGTYLMKRSGGKNTYMALPSTPSANGAYVLTVTVSGGSASYSWAAKE